MKRRQLIRYAGAGTLATLGLGALSGIESYQAQTSGLTIRWLGHMCFLFTGSGRRILVNPFRPVGCTARYRAPLVASDLVMISSRLFDEGYLDGLPGSPRVFVEPGVYELNDLKVQGIRTLHDREGGRRFGANVAWRWNQGGINNIVHMGGIASPVAVEEQILIGRPDIMFVPIGGGPKAYTPEEAVQAIATLKPKIVVPTQYRTQAADAAACDIVGLDAFLALMPGTPISRASGDTVTLQASSLPSSGTKIQIFNYAF